MILRAIDSTGARWKDEESVLDQVRRTFADVRAGLASGRHFHVRSRRVTSKARGVVSASVFGSTARGEERPDSDIDIVVDISLTSGSCLRALRSSRPTCRDARSQGRT